MRGGSTSGLVFGQADGLPAVDDGHPGASASRPPDRLRLLLGPRDAAVHLKAAGPTVAETETAGAREEERHEDDGPDLGEVPAEGRDEVDDELGGGLEVALEVGLGAHPALGGDGAQVLLRALEDDAPSRAEINVVLGGLGAGVVAVHRAGSLGLGSGALLDGPDVEDAGEHEGDDGREGPPLLEEDAEGD